eukprot:15452911-Alexandrium_andersonii.AAC.1
MQWQLSRPTEGGGLGLSTSLVRANALCATASLRAAPFVADAARAWQAVDAEELVRSSQLKHIAAAAVENLQRQGLPEPTVLALQQGLRDFGVRNRAAVTVGAILRQLEAVGLKQAREAQLLAAGDVTRLHSAGGR